MVSGINGTFSIAVRVLFWIPVGGGAVAAGDAALGDIELGLVGDVADCAGLGAGTEQRALRTPRAPRCDSGRRRRCRGCDPAADRTGCPGKSRRLATRPSSRCPWLAWEPALRPRMNTSFLARLVACRSHVARQVLRCSHRRFWMLSCCRACPVSACIEIGTSWMFSRLRRCKAVTVTSASVSLADSVVPGGPGRPLLLHRRRRRVWPLPRRRSSNSWCDPFRPDVSHRGAGRLRAPCVDSPDRLRKSYSNTRARAASPLAARRGCRRRVEGERP